MKKKIRLEMPISVDKAIKVIAIMSLYVFSTFLPARADEIYLNNGDKITGEIVEENDTVIVLNSAQIGNINIKKSFIKEIIREHEVSDDKPKENNVIWRKEISLGYNIAKGNTESQEIAGSFFINRNDKHVNEITLKGTVFYSEQARKMDSRKWYTLARYAYNFGPGNKWYNFYRLETDHDRFADVYYRMVPATGIGYWFFDEGSLKAMAEVGFGLEHTDFYESGKKNADELVLIPRLFVEKSFFDKITITQNIFLYPEIKDFKKYRLRSTTDISGKITDEVLLRLTLVDDYNSSPPAETKKNDMRVISSLVYTY
jgi:putative salt-induced outer membrane protein YdiY